jgi:hypothetical protein
VFLIRNSFTVLVRSLAENFILVVRVAVQQIGAKGLLGVGYDEALRRRDDKTTRRAEKCSTLHN